MHAASRKVDLHFLCEIGRPQNTVNLSFNDAKGTVIPYAYLTREDIQQKVSRNRRNRKEKKDITSDVYMQITSVCNRVGRFERLFQRQRTFYLEEVVLDLAVDVARHKFPSSLNSPVSPIKKPEIVSLFLLDATWSFRLVAASANHYLAHVANNRLKSSDRVKPVFDRDQCCNYRPCQPDFTIEGEACSPFYESRCKRSPRYFSKN